jgi:hypothetical protein
MLPPDGSISSVVLMDKRNLEVFKQAVALAGSGEFRDWREIQHQLIQNGFHRASDLLDGDKIRAVLNIQCERARQRL